MSQRFVIFVLFLGLGAPATLAWAGPITFNTALPVAKGEILTRAQFIYRRREDDTRRPNRDVTVRAGQFVAAYGVTSKLAVFGAVPYLDKDLHATTPRGRVDRSTRGFGDTTLFARYTAFQRDFQGASLRIAPIAGVIAPTGDDDAQDRFGQLPRSFQLGTGAFGGLFGAIVTYQTLQYEFDADATYRLHGSHDGFSAGDAARLDGSFQYRVWPRKLGNGLPAFLYAVLETNLVHRQRNDSDRAPAPASGGTQWFIAPGLQYVHKRYVLETAVQLPVAPNVNSRALKDDYIVHAGFRVNF